MQEAADIERHQLIGVPPIDSRPGAHTVVTGKADVLTSEILDAADPGLAVAWRDLYARRLERNIFMDPDFARPALGYSRPYGLKMMAVFEAGQNRLVALAPVVSPRVPFGIARVHVHKQATLGLPLLDKVQAGPALASLIDAIRALPGAPSALVFSEIPHDGPTARLLKEMFDKSGRIRILGQYERAALSSASAEPESRSKTKGEKNSFRRLRRLGERGALSYRSARGTDVPAALAEFLALEARGWKGARKTALASTPDRAGFVKAMAESFARDGKLRIESLDLDGKPVAMGLLLEEADGGYFWKIAYDEAYAALSPGVLLVREMTGRLSAHRTPHMTDSCAVANHPIDNIWPDRIAMLDIGLTLSSGPHGRIALAAETLRRSLRQTAKRLLRRGSASKMPITAIRRDRP